MLLFSFLCDIDTLVFTILIFLIVSVRKLDVRNFICFFGSVVLFFNAKFYAALQEVCFRIIQNGFGNFLQSRKLELQGLFFLNGFSPSIEPYFVANVSNFVCAHSCFATILALSFHFLVILRSRLKCLLGFALFASPH